MSMLSSVLCFSCTSIPIQRSFKTIARGIGIGLAPAQA